jgi:hypothetical protein
MLRILLRTIVNPRLYAIWLIYAVGLVALAVMFRVIGL